MKTPEEVLLALGELLQQAVVTKEFDICAVAASSSRLLIGVRDDGEMFNFQITVAATAESFPPYGLEDAAPEPEAPGSPEAPVSPAPDPPAE